MALLTVALPTYNGERYLDETIRAILAQSFKDFELLILDDSSRDGTLACVSRVTDPRIRVHCNEVNLGLPTNMNIALAMAKGKYLARVDQDDIPTPDRFARQVAYLEDHPEVTVVGSQIEHFGDLNAGSTLPLDDAQIKARFVSGDAYFANQASMGRTDFYQSHRLQYDASLYVVDDLGFWFDCMLQGAKFANLPEALTRYRVHRDMTSFNLDGARLDQSKERLYRRLLPIYFPRLTGRNCRTLLTLYRLGMRDGADLATLVDCHRIVGSIMNDVDTTWGQDAEGSRQALLSLLNAARTYSLDARTVTPDQCQVLDQVFHLAMRG